MEGEFLRNVGVYIYQVMQGFTPKKRTILLFTALENSNLTQVCNYILFFRLISEGMIVFGETAVAQWLRYCATNRKVAGSIPDGVIGIFH